MTLFTRSEKSTMKYTVYLNFGTDDLIQRLLLDGRTETFHTVIGPDGTTFARLRLVREMIDALEGIGARVMEEPEEKTMGKTELCGIEVRIRKLISKTEYSGATEFVGIRVSVDGDTHEDATAKAGVIIDWLRGYGVKYTDCIWQTETNKGIQKKSRVKKVPA